MKAIGGYPELELRKGEHYHKDALKLNTARNCLEYILLARKYSKVYVPYYTCEAVLEPFEKSPFPISYEQYHIDKDLEPIELPELKENEAFLYTNYFGLKQDCVERLSTHYGVKLIVDNSQAFFDMPVKGIDTFYSARKFFGVPDGAYLYTDTKLKDHYTGELETDISYDRMSALTKRIDLGAEAGYEDFQDVENSLSRQPIKHMSKLTDALLRSIDYNNIREIRRKNFKNLYWSLFQKNKLWLKLREEAVPLCYPILTKISEVRSELIKNKIFVPKYWPNVLNWCKPNSIEYLLAQEILPLPIDQRYSEEDMEKIISIIS